MARLRRSDNTSRRTAFIGANVSQEEKAKVERRAEIAGCRVSDFIRVMVLAERPGTAPAPKLAPEVGLKLAYELAKIGTNLNQMTHHANATGSLPVRDALDATLREIVRATEVLTLL